MIWLKVVIIALSCVIGASFLVIGWEIGEESLWGGITFATIGILPFTPIWLFIFPFGQKMDQLLKKWQKKQKVQKTEQITKEQAYQSYKNKELRRELIERYNTKEIELSGCLPMLLLVFAGGLQAIRLYTDQSIETWHIILLVLTGAIIFAPQLLQESWEQEIKFKERLKEESKTYKMPVYEYGYYYTDIFWKYALYQFVKAFNIIVSVLLICIIAVLLFLWMGTISIAPTTVIIILLVIIILNQKWQT